VGPVKQVTDVALKQTNGDSNPVKPEEKQPAEVTESPEKHKSSEESKSGEQGSVPTKVEPKESTTENKKQPTAGDKRDYELASAHTNTDKPSVENSTEPTNKRQRTTGRKIQNGHAAAPAINGEKKNAGRTKKVKDAVKKAIPTAGIGSRTRSRTKASS
jgi:hypothetical protein